MSSPNEYRDLPEELGREVRALYEKTKDDDDFSRFFRDVYIPDNSELELEQADALDRLIDWMYGTFEAIKQVRSHGEQPVSRTPEFNIFTTAIAGVYTASDWLHSGSDEDSATLIAMARQIQEGVAPIFRVYFDRQRTTGSGAPGSIDEGLSSALTEIDAIGALNELLRVQASVYSDMKIDNNVSYLASPLG